MKGNEAFVKINMENVIVFVKLGGGGKWRPITKFWQTKRVVEKRGDEMKFLDF